MFQNYLLCSHLPNEDLYDLYLYLKHQCLFSVCEEQPIGQLVVWREVFPTRQCYDLEEEQMFGYTEPVDASWYWLIVGLVSFFTEQSYFSFLKFSMIYHCKII